MKTHRLAALLRPHTLILTGAFICMALVALCNVAILPLVGKLSTAISGRDLNALNWIIGGIVGLFIIRGIFTYGQTYLMAYFSQRISTNLRVSVFDHIQGMSLDFFAKWRTGELISRLTSDLGVVQNAILNTATETIPQVLTFFGVLGYLFYLNWRLTMLSLIVTPVFLMALAKFGREIRAISGQVQRKTADITATLQETFTGIRVVKSFAREADELKRFRRENEDNFWLSMVEASISATQKPIMAFLQVAALVGVVWYGGLEVVRGRMEPGALISYFAGLGLLIDPIIVLSNVNLIVQKARAAWERVIEILEIAPSIHDAPHAKDLPPVTGRVTFAHVHFRYEENQPDVLSDINLETRAGDVIAIVGPSGAGKSTLVNLIPRFYDASQGQVLIDGFDIKDVTLHSLRSQIGIVPQETILFSGTVLDNIAYGRLEADRAEIEEAARRANAHDFIQSLPQGYATRVGEKGARLSGGQRQRIAIARAILRNPRILILDEATSSLDTESEQLVQEALETLMRGRTTFVIAHRLSTVKRADRILVLHDGTITEDGTHDELIEQNGIYRRLHDAQFKDDSLRDTLTL